MVAVAVGHIRWPSRIRVEVAQGCVAAGLALVLGAVSAHELRLWENDRKLFTRAVDVAPLNAEAVDMLAQSYEIEGERDKAEAIWREGLARIPNSARLSLALGSHFYTQGDYGRALVYLERLGNSNNAVALYELGLVEEKLGLMDRAVVHLQRAAELAPNNAGYRKTLETMRTTKLVPRSGSTRSFSSR
jgi:Tfp pilus assembly protein PilF